MTSPRISMGMWIAGIALVSVAAAAAYLALRGGGGLTARESDGGVHYLAYPPGAVNDAVAYEGRLSIDGEGCVLFTLEDDGSQYVAAFRAGTTVTKEGVETDLGTRVDFGELVTVGREHDVSFGTADRSGWPACAATGEVFGLGFF